MKHLDLIAELAMIITKNVNFDIKINSIIERLGNYTQLSRVYVFRDNEDNTQTTNTFEWCSDNIEPQIDKLQNFPYENIPSLRKFFKKEGRMYSENVKELPDDLTVELESQGILSVAVYPLIINNKINGFIGFDDCKSHRNWDPKELKVLAIVAQIVANIYEKELAQAKTIQMENDFEHFFYLMEDLFIIASMQGEIIFANKAVNKTLGYSKEEIKKINIIELHPTEKRKEASEILFEILAGRQEKCPIELETKEGHILPVETRIWISKWNNKECLFIVSKNLSKEQEALQKFSKLFEHNPALMAVSGVSDHKFLDVNTAFVEKMGYSYSEIIGKSTNELEFFVKKKVKAKIGEKIRKYGRVHNLEIQVKTKAGEIIEGLFSGEIIKSQGKDYFLTVMADITPQKKLQRLYNNEKERLESIIEGARLGTWEWNIQTGETIFNERWAEIIGYKLSELEPVNIETWKEKTHPEDLKETFELFDKHFNKQTDFYEADIRMKHKDGYWVWIHNRGKVIKWNNVGEPIMMYGTHTDITEKKEIEKKIKELSIRDSLTNSYNRRFIYEVLSKNIEMFKRNNTQFSVAILDIDFFKKINDKYGHLAGDYILKEFTKVMTNNLRKYDFLGRYGGEEFIILMPQSTKANLAVVVERILNEIRNKTFVFGEKEIKFTFSAGIADILEVTLDKITNESIISIADKRLYEAKASGRNKIELNI